jgi:hypothetical protein
MRSCFLCRRRMKRRATDTTSIPRAAKLTMPFREILMQLGSEDLCSPIVLPRPNRAGQQKRRPGSVKLTMPLGELMKRPDEARPASHPLTNDAAHRPAAGAARTSVREQMLPNDAFARQDAA